jgi:hypothetical protein
MKLQLLTLVAAAFAGEFSEFKFERHCDAAVSGVGGIVLTGLSAGAKQECSQALRRSCIGASKKLTAPADSDARMISDHRFTLAELSVTMVAGHRSFGDRCMPALAALDQESRSACAETAAFAAGFIPQDRYVLAALVVTGQADADSLEARVGEEGAKTLRSDVRRLERMPSSVLERLRMMFGRCPYAKTSTLASLSRRPRALPAP